MMTQPGGRSPIRSHGTSSGGRRAKPYPRARARRRRRNRTCPRTQRRGTRVVDQAYAYGRPGVHHAASRRLRRHFRPGRPGRTGRRRASAATAVLAARDPAAERGQPDRLTIVVSGTGNPLADGEYLLECEPVGGNHPEAEQACARLGEFAKAGKDPFAADNRRQLCTMQDGGPATAHVTGTWQGHKVDTTFRRKNGCEISRWNDLEPVLPPARA